MNKSLWTLEDVLRHIKENNQKLFIPSYQRGYRWQPSEVRQLLDDVYNNTAGNYFLQVLAVREDSEKKQLRIVDGQQRLTTVLLVLNCLDGGNRCLELIEYETRNKGCEKTLDGHFREEAIKAINTWLADKAENEKNTFRQKLGNCEFLDFRIEDEKSELGFFSRLNTWKIAATDSELVECFFLSNDNPCKIEKRAIKWNQMERQLSDNKFWGMLARGKLLIQWENFKGVFARHLDVSARDKFCAEIEALSDKYFELFEEVPDEAFFGLFGRVSDYILRYYYSAKYDASKEENLTSLALGKKLYVPIEELNLEFTSSWMVEPILLMLEWVLGEGKDAVLRYWEKEPAKVREVLLAPHNENDRDFALFLFEYFSRYKTADGLCENSCRALRLVANILENVSREAPMRPEDNNYLPGKHFNRIACLKDFLEQSSCLYNASRVFDDKAPMQLNEELAKAWVYQRGIPEQIVLLQNCERYMRGRVRMALLTGKADGGNWRFSGIADLEHQQKRLATFYNLLDKWHFAKKEQRVELLKKVVSCEPWKLKDQICLSLEDEGLKKILSTSDDVYLQKTYLDEELPDDSIGKTEP